MGKRELYMALLCLFLSVNNSLAQSTACAYQRIELHVHAAIEMLMPDFGAANVSFNKEKGAVSSNQQLQINSNRHFIITAHADSNYSQHNGKQLPASASRTALNSLNNNINEQAYATPIDNDTIMSKGRGEKLFAINCNVKAPGKNVSGDYAIGMIYTATEL